MTTALTIIILALSPLAIYCALWALDKFYAWMQR
jgi:hypothetical protein